MTGAHTECITRSNESNTFVNMAYLDQRIQNYGEANNFLGEHDSLKVAHETFAVRDYDTGAIHIRYQATNVVTHFEDGRTILRADGRKTKTTKKRMNDFSLAHVYQQDGVWYVETPLEDEPREFEEGFEFN